MATRADPPRALSLRAPAKVNLGLRITGRRPDGYHTIDSLFVPLDLADELRVTVHETSEGADAHVALTVRGLGARELPTGDDNLAVRAARRFLERAGVAARVDIELRKHVPAAAGLGGGSSDAAAVLRALARLLPGALPERELAPLALALGADVPFFLDPRPARVRGIGERVEPVEGVPALALVLANPGISLSTAEVYAAWDERAAALTPPGPRPTMRAAFGPPFDVAALAGRSGADALERVLENDLEGPATAICPSIADLERELVALGARAVAMSGSGATVYGVFESSSRADVAVARGTFPPPVWARAVNTLPSA